MLIKCGSENISKLYFGSSRITVLSGSTVDTFASAFAGNYDRLRNWFQRNTGPTIQLSESIVGNVTITNQSEADALIGVMVTGRVIVNASDIEIHDFGVQWDGSGTGTVLLESVNGVDNVHVYDFLLDGGYGNISYGLTGTTYSENWTVERGEIKRMGGDGVRTFKNSTYRHLFIHSFREWDEDVDGEYNGSGSQSLYPHTDGIQTIRSGNLVEECFIDNTDAINATSACIVKSDTDETIDGFTLRRSYLNGGGFVIYTDNANSNIMSPGTYGQPINITFEDLRIGPDYRTAVYRHEEVPSTSFTKSNVVFVDSGNPVPDLFIDDFNRSNENLEAATATWQRVSGAAGALSVDTNRIRSNSTTQSTYLLHPDVAPSLTDHFAQATWLTTTGTTGWMIIRYTDESNYVGMQLLSGVPTLYRRVGGAFTVLGAFASYNSGDKVRIEAEGQTVRMYRNGTVVVEDTLPVGVLTSGRVGLQSRTTTINPLCDNFIAGTLPGYST